MIREKVTCFDIRRVSVRLSYLVHVVSPGSIVTTSTAQMDDLYRVSPFCISCLSSVRVSVERGEIE